MKPIVSLSPIIENEGEKRVLFLPWTTFRESAPRERPYSSEDSKGWKE